MWVSICEYHFPRFWQQRREKLVEHWVHDCNWIWKRPWMCREWHWQTVPGDNGRHLWPQVISEFYRTFTILGPGEANGLLVSVIPTSLVNLLLEVILPASRKKWNVKERNENVSNIASWNLDLKGYSEYKHEHKTVQKDSQLFTYGLLYKTKSLNYDELKDSAAI